MIALAIVSIALVVMLGLTQRNILVSDRLHQMTRATLLAKQLMAEIESGTATDRRPEPGGFPGTESAIQLARQLQPNADFRYRANRPQRYLGRRE